MRKIRYNRFWYSKRAHEEHFFLQFTYFQINVLLTFCSSIIIKNIVKILFLVVKSN